MKIRSLILLMMVVVVASVGELHAQMVITMEKAIELSLTGSPDLQKSALNLERYQKLLDAQKASLNSQVSLNLNPLSYSKSRYFDSRLSQWYTNESLSSTGTLSVEQPIVLTGTTISLNNEFGWNNNQSQIVDGENNTDIAYSNSLYLSLNQPLFTYNEIKQELQSIEMDYENALISYALTRLQLEQNITSRFYSVYMAQDNLLISEEELKNAEDNFNVIKEKVNLGLSPRSEQFQAELNVATSRSTVENRRVTLETAKDNLKEILGLPLDLEIATEANVEETSVYVNPDLAVENALSTRLELRQREITNKSAEFDLIRIKDNGKFKGNVGLSIGIMGDNPVFGDIYSNPTQNPRVSISFSVPIFDWGARRSRIKAQELLMDMNDVDENSELVSIEMDVRQTCRSLHNLMLQIEIAKKSVENAQQTYDLNVEKYRAGEITGMDMSQFQTQLSTQKSTLSQRLVDYKIELLNLKVISLYDFEKKAPISPMLMYSTASMKKYDKYMKDKQEKK